MTGHSGIGGEGIFPRGSEAPDASACWVTEDPGLRRNGNSACPLFLRELTGLLCRLVFGKCAWNMPAENDSCLLKVKEIAETRCFSVCVCLCV